NSNEALEERTATRRFPFYVPDPLAPFLKRAPGSPIRTQDFGASRRKGRRGDRLMMSSTHSTSLPPSINFGVASRARLSTCSKKLLELLDCQTGIADNCSHRVGIDRIIARHDNPDRTLRHENVFAL